MSFKCQVLQFYKNESSYSGNFRIIITLENNIFYRKYTRKTNRNQKYKIKLMFSFSNQILVLLKLPNKSPKTMINFDKNNKSYYQ